MKTKRIFYSIPLLGLLLLTTNGWYGCSLFEGPDQDTLNIFSFSYKKIKTVFNGYNCHITYSYLPYTADSAKIALRLQVDSVVEHADYFDAFKVYLADNLSMQSSLLIEHNQPLPLETSTNIYLSNDTMYNILIQSHINTVYCKDSNNVDSFTIPIQVHKGEISNIAQQDVSHKENIEINIPHYISKIVEDTTYTYTNM